MYHQIVFGLYVTINLIRDTAVSGNCTWVQYYGAFGILERFSKTGIITLSKGILYPLFNRKSIERENLDIRIRVSLAQRIIALDFTIVNVALRPIQSYKGSDFQHALSYPAIIYCR
jgi:methylaspartate ammonia-lyase